MAEVTHLRVDLAVEELQVAIELFLSGRSDVAALTLAGAAEEILGQAVKLQGGQNALQQHFEIASSVHHARGRTLLKWQTFVDGENYARNAAKHMKEAGQTMTVDVRRAAQWMIVRAVTNYDCLGLLQTELMLAFGKWFYENEVGGQ